VRVWCSAAAGHRGTDWPPPAAAAAAPRRGGTLPRRQALARYPSFQASLRESRSENLKREKKILECLRVSLRVRRSHWPGVQDFGSRRRAAAGGRRGGTKVTGRGTVTTTPGPAFRSLPRHGRTRSSLRARGRESGIPGRDLRLPLDSDSPSQ
jgi:hypothetical protein